MREPNLKPEFTKPTPPPAPPLSISRLPFSERRALRQLATDARDLIAECCNDLDAIGHEDLRLVRALDCVRTLTEALE